MLKLVALRGQALGHGSKTPSIASGKSSTATEPPSTPSASSSTPSTRSSSAPSLHPLELPSLPRDAELDALMSTLANLKRHIPEQYAIVKLVVANCLACPPTRRRRQRRDSPPWLPFETLFTVAQVVAASMLA